MIGHIQTNTKIDLLPNNIAPLDEYLKDRCIALRDVSGIYSFWWLNENTETIEKLYRTAKLKGKQVNNNHQVHDVAWKWNIEKPQICLYAGKATCIKKRVDQHLQLTTSSSDWYGKSYKIHRNKKTIVPDRIADFLVKRTTACQFRAGIEHLFKHSSIELSEKLANIGFSFVEELDLIERFYLEDLAIGIYRPWFNVDVER
jgi:hypothetical protein